MAVKKYYAVRKGRNTGVFTSWAECQKQTKGFSGAVFKSFTSREEAEAFVHAGSTDTGISSGADIQEKKALFAESGVSLSEIEAGALTAYVDGSYHIGTQAFSYGMVLLDGREEWCFCEKYNDEKLAGMRNVAGEIKGAEAAMRFAVEHGFSKLYLYHDYEGIAKWCQGVWKANKEGTKAYKAYFDSIRDKVEVVFVKVAAHTGDHYNEMADKLAKKALGLL